MANIPDKSDGDVLTAANLFKVAGADNTGGTTSSGSEVTIATVALSADQLSAGALLMAAVSYSGNNTTSTFKLKRGATVLQTLVLGTGSGITGTNQIGGSLLYFDTGATFSGAVTYTVTGQSTSGATCLNLTVAGV